jgi:NTP pyrophosphatase (non-canonical NTP hydrolase)
VTIKKLQGEIDVWIKTVGVRYFSEMTNTCILAEEVGEFSKIVARHYGDQSFKNPTTVVESKEMLKEELADILWVVCCLANQMDIDLEDAMKINFDKKNTRDINRHKNNNKLKP